MAKTLPKVYYGLHFYDGLAEYREPNKEPYRVLVNEATMRDMDATFAGCPVYVRHKEEVNLDKLQEEADGYVIESFYNNADGKHWVKFIVVSDKGHTAIKQGWKLSNAYYPESFGPGGVWNGIEYTKEITKAKFEHLAIVDDPRYQYSIVLEPSQFREYNESHILELKKIANSQSQEKKSMFDFFKKTKVENTEKLEEITVTLPKSGKQVTIAQLINAADQEKDEEKKEAEKKKENEDKSEKGEHEAKSMDKKAKDKNPMEAEKQGEKEESKDAAPQMANMDHHVMVGNESRPLKDVMAEHKEMKDCMSSMGKYMKNDEQQDGGEKDAEATKKADLTKKNADLDGGEKEGVKEEAEEDLTKRNSKFFNDLKNAPDKALDKPQRIDLDKAERGRSRYGSGN